MDPAAPRILALRKLLARVNGARLCYGQPIKANGRTIIPVAKMFAAGGGGFGSGDGTPGEDGPDGLGIPEQTGVAAQGPLARVAGRATGAGTGGGGGGTLTATPIGFIEVSEDGTRFEAIPDPERSARLLALGVKALPALMAAVAGFRALRGGAGANELRSALRAPRGRDLRRRTPGLLGSPRRSPWR